MTLGEAIDWMESAFLLLGIDGNGSSGPALGNTVRKLIVRPKTDHIRPKKNAVIYVQVMVNAEGEIVYAQNIRSKMTTTDARIINQVITAVKKDVRFSKAPGTPNSVQYIPVKLYAQ